MLLSTGQASGRESRDELTLGLLGLGVSANTARQGMDDPYIVALINWHNICNSGISIGEKIRNKQTLGMFLGRHVSVCGMYYEMVQLNRTCLFILY